jgi:hypothetical protein
MAFLVGTSKIYNFHTVTPFECRPPGTLPASLAGDGDGKDVRNSQTVRNRRRMVESETTTDFVLGC